MIKILFILFTLLIVLGIIIIICCKKKNHDNFKAHGWLIKTKLYDKTPYYNKIHLTTKDVKKTPKHIFDRLKKYAKNYEYKIYNDQDCINYLKKNYNNNEYVKRFKSFKNGCHKADLFRYAILYKEGGIYLDIKTFLIKPLKEIFQKRDLNYSVLSINKDTIYQGILYSPPKNPLYLKLLEKLITTKLDKFTKDIVLPTRQFYKILANNKKLKSGINNTDYGLWYLFKEKCIIDCKNKKLQDQYGYCCSVLDKNNKIFITRDPQYGKSWTENFKIL